MLLTAAPVSHPLALSAFIASGKIVIHTRLHKPVDFMAAQTPNDPAFAIAFSPSEPLTPSDGEGSRMAPRTLGSPAMLNTATRNPEAPTGLLTRMTGIQ